LVKPYFSFEFFYFLHIACFLAMVPILFIHSAFFFPLSIIVWAIDVILRYVITLKKVEMQATLLPGRIVKLSMPKTFAYSPGQYCFLQVKGLSAVEYHPFSISTSPLQDDITFHIRPLGEIGSHQLLFNHCLTCFIPLFRRLDRRPVESDRHKADGPADERIGGCGIDGDRGDEHRPRQAESLVGASGGMHRGPVRYAPHQS
jgi:hypothetical protein